MARARGRRASASRRRAPAASGWRTGRWCTSCGRCGRRAGAANQRGRAFPPLTYTDDDAAALRRAHAGAAHRARRARSASASRVQYGNAFGQGLQAAALKPADFFGDDDVLYLMEDMATGEIRVSILWEWLHKQAPFTDDDAATGVRAGDTLDAGALRPAARRGVRQAAGRRQSRRPRRLEGDDPADRPRHRRDAGRERPVKAPWYIDLLNLTLDNHDRAEARPPRRRLHEGVRRRRHAHHPQRRVRSRA